MSDPSISDINFKNKMALVWTTLKYWKYDKVGCVFSKIVVSLLPHVDFYKKPLTKTHHTLAM